MADMANKPMRLGDIVARLGGELIGDPETEVRKLATLQNARPGDLTFLSQSRYRRFLATTKATAVILARSERESTELPRIICADPYLYYAKAAQLLVAPRIVHPGVHPSAVIEADAHVASSASVGAHVYIGHRARVGDRTELGPGVFIGDDAVLGDDCLLYANVVVYHRCRLGHRAIVHSGAVIGADGFGMVREGGAWLKIPQIGRVLIGDDVEIGASTTIDRGALDDTVIGNGVKLDNQIQVGHNVHIGAHSALAGCVGIAGSARIGEHCTIGGGAVILGHLEIADHVHVSAATLISKSIAKPGSYTGVYPFSEHGQWSRSAALLRHLDELAQRVGQLESERSAASTITKNSPKARAGTARAGSASKKVKHGHS